MAPYVLKGCKSTPRLERAPKAVQTRNFPGAEAFILPKLVPPSLPNPLMKVLEWKQLSHQNLHLMLNQETLDDWFTKPLEVKIDVKDPLMGLQDISNLLDSQSSTTKNPKRGMVISIEKYLTQMVLWSLLERKSHQFSSNWLKLIEFGNGLINLCSKAEGNSPCLAHLCSIVHKLNAIVCSHLSKRQNYIKWDKLAKKHLNLSDELLPLIELVETYPVFWNNQLKKDSQKPNDGELVLPGRLKSKMIGKENNGKLSKTSWWNVHPLENLPRGRAYILPIALYNQDINSIINAMAWLLFDIVKEHGCDMKVSDLVFLL